MTTPQQIRPWRVPGGKPIDYMEQPYRRLEMRILLQDGTLAPPAPEPPSRCPDTMNAIGWRYVLVGKVNLTTGTVEKTIL